jgi:hypothetical protein
MAKGIQLTGGFGAGGVRDALVELIAQRMAEADFEEKRRQAFNAEGLARETLGQRKTEAGMEDARAKAALRENQRQFGENLGLNVKKLGEDTRQFDTKLGEETRQFDTGLEFKKGESVREQGNTERGFGLKERQLTEEERANREGEGIARRRVAGSGSGGANAKTTEQLDALADMVLKDPELLKNLPPTDRSRVLAHIGTSKEGGLPNKRTETMRSTLDASLDTIQRLKDMPGMTGAVGAKGPMSLFGLLEKPMAGSSASNYASYVDALKSQLTLPRMEMMRGLGAMSDREFKTLSDSATALNRDMSENEFLRELTNIETTLSGVRERMGGAAEPGGGGAGAGQQFDFDPKTGALVPRGVR